MNPRHMIQAGLQLKELLKVEKWTADIEKVSLMENSISKIPIDMLPPKCQLLTTLFLQENPIKNIPNSFFAIMPCLGVLNLSKTKIECLPDSISELNNLTALLLGGCSELKHVPCLVKLQRLKKLDLGGTEIEEVPEGMDMLINLRYLDLGVTTLKGIPVGLLPKLSLLQHLRFDGDNEKTRLTAEEVVALEKLEFFYGSFKDMHELKKFVSSMQRSKTSIINYQLQVGSSDFSFTRDKGVSMNEIEVDGGELMLPTNIQDLKISNCHNLRSLSDDDAISSLKNAIDLRDCGISDCKGIEYVVFFSYVSSSSTTHLFQRLEKLWLVNLPNLRVVMGEIEGFGTGATTITSILAPSTATFSHLRELYIQNCGSMKILLPHWLLPNLQNLDIIHVSYCNQLVEILGGATTTLELEGSSTTDALIKYKLPKLKVLELWSLPELKSIICSKSGVMVCDSLQRIDVFECRKLKRIPAFVPHDDDDGNGQKKPYEYAPPSLEIYSKEWWESLEWDDDHPNFKNILEPHCPR